MKNERIAATVLLSIQSARASRRNRHANCPLPAPPSTRAVSKAQWLFAPFS